MDGSEYMNLKKATMALVSTGIFPKIGYEEVRMLMAPVRNIHENRSA